MTTLFIIIIVIISRSCNRYSNSSKFIIRSNINDNGSNNNNRNDISITAKTPSIRLNMRWDGNVKPRTLSLSLSGA